MTRELIGFIAIAFVGLIAVAIYFSVRSKRAKQEAVYAKPAHSEKGELVARGLYVSTVLAASPLERIWAYGLGSRGKVEISHSNLGISFDRTGETSFLIPASAVLAVGRASATIDKGVERDGLVVIEWQLGDHALLTHLRFADSKDGFALEDKISALIGAQVG